MASENLKNKKKLIVMIPAYNEEKTIGQVIENIPKIKGIEVETLLVDDGSTDNTIKEAKKAGVTYILKLPENRGLGVAFKKGLEKAIELNADYIVNIDADTQFNPKDIPKLLKPILKNEADVVICTRFKDKDNLKDMSLIKNIGNRIFTTLINFLTNSNFTDTQCGFRAYTRDVAMRMNLFSRFSYTQESIIDLTFKNYRIREVSCKVKAKREGKSRLVSSIPMYTIKSIIILVRTIRDQKPLLFFGVIGVTITLIGFILGLYMVINRLLGGVTTYEPLIAITVLLLTIGFLLIILALISDMLGRQRRLIEEQNYLLKRMVYDRESK